MSVVSRVPKSVYLTRDRELLILGDDNFGVPGGAGLTVVTVVVVIGVTLVVIGVTLVVVVDDAVVVEVSIPHTNSLLLPIAAFTATPYGRPKMVASATCSTCRKSGGGSNANWKGGQTTHKRGYVMVWAPKHPRAARSRYVFEHILVMEESIGRCLIEGETVRH